MKPLKILILIAVIITSGYYLLAPLDISEENLLDSSIPKSDPIITGSEGNINDNRDFSSSESVNNYFAIGGEAPIPVTGTGSNRKAAGTDRRLEIFGRIVDRHNQPIDNVIVTEERYFYSTQSDADGNYRIFVGMPLIQYPVMRFLRNGFEDKSITLGAGVLKQKSVLKLDVILDDNTDSITVDGWVGNDIGVSLEGLKIQISSRDNFGVGRVFYTTLSDDRGFFTFEGIRSGDLYRLTVLSPPEYLYYVDEEFSVTHNSPQINIVLESLKFIDIDGMIVNPKAEPVPNFVIYISNISTGTHARKLETDSSGFFSLRKFPAGDVILSTQGPEYFKITGLTLAPTEYRNLRLVVDKGDHHLLGWVSDESGVPVAKALVTLNSEIKAGAIEYLSYRVQGSDSAGNFSFGSVGSGAHLITVKAPGFNRKEITHRFDSQTEKVHIPLSRIR